MKSAFSSTKVQGNDTFPNDLCSFAAYKPVQQDVTTPTIALPLAGATRLAIRNGHRRADVLRAKQHRLAEVDLLFGPNAIVVIGFLFTDKSTYSYPYGQVLRL